MEYSRDEQISFMDRIERDWMRKSGCKDRSEYSIFYSLPNQSDLLFLNINPGGDAESYKIVDVKAGYHEYVEGYGKTSQNTGEFLRQVLKLPNRKDVNFVQGGNVVFRRSKKLSKLPTNYENEARSAQPFLAEYINFVKPKCIIFGGTKCYKVFSKIHKSSERAFPNETVKVPNGSNMATGFARYELKLPYYENLVRGLVILHPSKGIRQEIVRAVQQAMG
jgi:hypothetical protein